MIPIADLQEQLQAILGDPNAMGQITAIARALTGSSQSTPQPPTPSTAEAQDVEFIPVEADSKEVPPSNTAPELSTLLGALGSGASNIDPKFISFALELLSEYSAENDEKTALLLALKPFLKAERIEKIEKAEKLSRLTRIVRIALRRLKEERENV